MLIITHLLFALILGKIFGNTLYIVLGAIIIDLDHLYYLFKYEKNNIKKFLKQSISQRKAPIYRTFFHSILGWFITSLILMLIDTKIGLFFSIGYLSHLVLDALDGSKSRFFYPLKNYITKGPIEYNSIGEYIIIISLVLIYSALL